MLSTLSTVFLIILLFVFQTTVLHAFTISGVRPDIILIFSVFVGIKLRETRGAAAGFTLGLVQDSLSSGLLGANAFSKGIVGFAFGLLKDKIIFENIFSQVIFVLIATVIDTVIVLLISSLTINENVTTIFNKLLLSSIYTTLAGPLFIYVFIFVSSKASVFAKKY